jgi:hypothetical protein
MGTVSTDQEIDFIRQLVNKTNLPDCEISHTDSMNPVCSQIAVARFYVKHARKSVLGCQNTLQIVLDGLREAELCPCGRAERDCLIIYPI